MGDVLEREIEVPLAISRGLPWVTALIAPQAFILAAPKESGTAQLEPQPPDEEYLSFLSFQLWKKRV